MSKKGVNSVPLQADTTSEPGALQTLNANDDEAIPKWNPKPFLRSKKGDCPASAMELVSRGTLAKGARAMARTIEAGVHGPNLMREGRA